MPGCSAARSEVFESSYDLVGDKLGYGAFGTLWRCWKIRPGAKNGHAFAAKQMDKSQLMQYDVWNLFGSEKTEGEGEIKLHLRQKHPHIVQLFEVFDEALKVTLVMEACDGGDLFHHVTSHKRLCGVGVSEEAATAVMAQMLSALDYLHQQSIVHRDVKCENVLLRHRRLALERNTCKLCDFGLASHLPLGGVFQEPVGSLDYAAPEMCKRGCKRGLPMDSLQTSGQLASCFT